MEQEGHMQSELKTEQSSRERIIKELHEIKDFVETQELAGTLSLESLLSYAVKQAISNKIPPMPTVPPLL